MNVCFTASQTQEFGNYIIFGTGDYNPVFGPGADPAFDSPEGISRIMKYFKSRGFTGVMHRPDFSALTPEYAFRIRSTTMFQNTSFL